MKKTYISPEILIQKIELQQMIAGSGDPVVNTTDTPAEKGGEVLSRRNDWDDEDDW